MSYQPHTEALPVSPEFTPPQAGGGIIVTGAAGFIGSCMVQYLNELGYTNLILVDEFSRDDKIPNLKSKQFHCKVEREDLFEWLFKTKPEINFVIHLGARTDTTEFNYAVHQHLNVEYSQQVWNYCTLNDVPLIYASSAATYGDGELGYKDDHELCSQLKPLNPYGISKNEFDKWVLHQEDHPPFWAGLKFFNVYGPNEYHKGKMASVIYHSYNQIKKDGLVKLFRSHKTGFKDGEQLRDFIYVKDVVRIIAWMMENYNRQSSVVSSELTTADSRLTSAIYNLGTGKARTFNDLVKATFSAMNIKPSIQYINIPEDIRERYQYFTEADMTKLKTAGYKEKFASLENGVEDYVRNYLSKTISY